SAPHAQRKRANATRTPEVKQRYCELCLEYYPSLRSHLESSNHIRRAGPANEELERIVAQFETNDFHCPANAFASPSPSSSSTEAITISSEILPRAAQTSTDTTRVEAGHTENSETTSILSSPKTYRRFSSAKVVANPEL
ncbi:hypothetical protein BIW11_09294, partial [Tropilaelaps mercedesae]